MLCEHWQLTDEVKFFALDLFDRYAYHITKVARVVVYYHIMAMMQRETKSIKYTLACDRSQFP